MPHKPSKPLGHFVFPQNGALSRVVEVLPDSKDELEQVIALKFATALRSRFDRELAVPIRGDEWPDFWTSEGKATIGLEVVEVVNPDHVAQGQAYRSNLPVSVDRARELLTETIQKKIAKGYQTARDWSLWLVAYDVTSALAAEHDLAARDSNTFFRSVEHPFTEIWLLWPTTGEIPSFLESVWPTTEFTSTEP